MLGIMYSEMKDKETQELASELAKVLENHADHLQAGIRHTNGEYYVVVRKKKIQQPKNQINLFEGATTL